VRESGCQKDVLREGGGRMADRRVASILLLVLAFLLPERARAADDIAVTASVDRNAVRLGESVILTVETVGTQNVPAPDLGDVSAFQAQYMGPSTQISIVNGEMTSRASHSFRLTPQRTGSFRVGPIVVELDGKKYSAGEVRIDVTAGAPARGAGAAPNDLRLLVLLPKNQLYLGEQLPLQVKLLVSNTRIDDLQFPQIAADGVLVDKMPQPGRSNEIIDGRNFQVLTFPTTLTGIRPGDVRLSATMGMSLVVPRGRRRGGDPFFDRFFGSGFADKRPVNIESEAVSLTVLPLPEEEKPPGFAGAVGQFDFALEAQPTELKAGDPVTVRMRITGRGDLSRVAAPPIPVGDGFRAYDPTAVKEEENEQTRVFEQVVIPREPTITALPPVSFSFFDPSTGRYQTLTRGPIRLNVQAGEVAVEPRIVGPQGEALRPARTEELGRDIVYIKDTPGSFGRRGAPFYRSAWFAALQTLPPLGFAVLLVFSRRRERLASDPRFARFRQAGREARRALAALEDEGADGPFYDRLGGTIQAYLGAKLDLPPGAVERARVLERLGRNGSAEEVRERVESLFALIEEARYAPASGGAGERQTALRLAHEIVDRLERQGGRGWTAAIAPALAALLASMSSGAAEDARPFEPYAVFFQGNTAYREGRYDDAIREYQQVVDAGYESGSLYFNLANAEFKSGRIGAAVRDYERARRLLPRDPDVRANLRYAIEQAGVDPVEPPLWKRIAFPLAGALTTGELAPIIALLWLAFWATLAVALIVAPLRPAWRRVAWAMGLLLAFFASNLAVRVWDSELTRRAVVTAGGETAVRFEPAESGTEHFRAREGDLLVVGGESGDWYRVERGDGRRGWIPSGALGLVE
jgi:tetratricopeptide (TPR) repeat protein